uniref:Two-component sensor histidine kinase n=1 Tax=Bursaphelenchus xylophilus TaxID=6326 RepID=A0A1I7RKL0_BURXY
MELRYKRKWLTLMNRTSCSCVLKTAVLMLTLLALYSLIAGFSYYGFQIKEYQSQFNVDGPFQNDDKQAQELKTRFLSH